jgi:hypothetical protein
VVPDFRLIHSVVFTLTGAATVGVMAKNLHEYKKELVVQDFEWKYNTRKHIMDVMSMVMGVADFGLDIKAVVSAFAFDHSIGEGVSNITLWMLLFVVIPHVFRAVRAAWAAHKKAEEGKGGEEAAQAFAIAFVFGQIEALMRANKIIEKIIRAGSITPANLHLKEELADIKMDELQAARLRRDQNPHFFGGSQTLKIHSKSSSLKQGYFLDIFMIFALLEF